MELYLIGSAALHPIKQHICENCLDKLAQSIEYTCYDISFKSKCDICGGTFE